MEDGVVQVRIDGDAASAVLGVARCEDGALERRVFEALKEHIAVVDSGGGIIRANRAWSKFAAENGAAELQSVQVGANYLDVCRRAAASGDPSVNEALAGIEAVLRGESEQFSIEYPCHSSVEQRWFNMTVVPLRDGSPTGAVISHRNITQHKQAEEELRQSEERLRTAAVAAQFGTYDVDVVTGTAHWSPEMKAILGRPENPPMLTPPGAPLFVHPEDSEEVGEVFRHALSSAGDGIVEHEHRIVRPDGAVRWVLLKGRVRFSGEGEQRRAIRSTGILFDITARKEIELQLAQSLRDLNQAQDELVRRERLAILGQLAGAVAHEMRSPLAVIHNTMYYLRGALPFAENIRAALEEAKRAVARSDQIITELIEYVRESSPHRRDFAIGDAIARAIRSVPPSGSIRLQGPTGGEIQVRANPDHVTRILVKLIQNALQAMKQAGVLEIGAVRNGENKVVVRVRDTGCGIPPENREKIFEPLFSTKITGFGFGLAIARRYARLNGGELTVQSDVGNGTTFELELDAAT